MIYILTDCTVFCTFILYTFASFDKTVSYSFVKTGKSIQNKSTKSQVQEEHHDKMTPET